ncbi:TPA: hypothetical protein I0F57_RS06530 [Enterococcus faecalis]|nr:hypothetical protein [Enterococcus faecalis]EHQ8829863.1 hypothetical protein [Enterococcus faecalis]NSM29903.1 hypothetical protein [Enterococcus faecalis]HBI1545153.1 hypothetical protein [Enterococcus faecalis]HBI1638041.1 hypothetical protein [Enterococcus faecalis]
MLLEKIERKINMSYYNHMHDSKGTEEICHSCGKKFAWEEYGDIYPGGKDTEYIRCPWCNENNGSIRTSGFVSVSKVEK